MSDVPPEMIREILIRLPVKSLLRFRCVSKPWRSMIDSKHFTKLHLHHSYKTSSNRTLVVNSVELFYIDLDALERLDIGDNKFKPNSVVLSCYGLVLLVFGLDNVVLWNPATRKFNKLPATPLDYQVPNNSSYCLVADFALGYDSKHDDYKVVRLIQVSTWFDARRLYSETKVFSLKSNTWKRIEDIPYLLPVGRKLGVYLNDAIHAVVRDGQLSDVIMAFDIAKEEHREVPKPGGMNGSLASVDVMGGCLTATVAGKSNSSEIYVMKEYGVKESWTKLLCFEPPVRDPCLKLCPLAFSKSGDAVLFNYGGMCLNWYDLRKKTVSIPCVPGLTPSFNASTDDPFDAVLCIGSLVSPHSPSRTGYEPQRKMGKEIKKKRDDFLSVGFKLVL